MNSKLTLVLLAAAMAAQIAVPAGVAWQQEAALRWGRQIKAHIEPVDPVQPFMGRYVALHFRDLMVTDAPDTFKDGEKVYVTLGEDKDGFAHAKAVVADPPKDQPCLPARMDWRETWRVTYAFDRFYLSEAAAPEVDRQVAARRMRNTRSPRDDARNAYVTIRVRKGTATLEELYVDNLPVGEFLRAQAANAN